MNNETAISVRTEPVNLVQLAIDRGVAADQLEKLVALAERTADRQAEIEFAESKVRFQAEVPPIKKVRKVGSAKKLSFKYAGYDDVIKTIQPYLTKNRISISFNTEESKTDRQDSLAVVCRIRVGSYYEDTRFVCPIPKELTVTGTQKVGAALQYAKRYALGAALGLVFADEDDESTLLSNTGGDDDIEVIINDEQVKEVEQLIKDVGADRVAILAHYKINKLEEMNEPSYRNLKSNLEPRRKK